MLRPQCKCIEDFKEKLKVEKNAQFVSEGYLYLSVRYVPTTLRGEPSRHGRYEGMDFKFCPFCAKPYEEVST